ncbi:Multidrug efflux membrane permease [Candidatus Jidaibacter acanthamoeba]|uniref:Multidrug efflux membrane permease n=2 Tax=Candidatus Jidaibacter acanthamoebae TaxID=86105 RepID=A0A0C1QZZ0_9RICK|nr:Multidrug efflux membrane permease [Candidatus Jidaibacter acanthamoeba]
MLSGFEVFNMRYKLSNKLSMFKFIGVLSLLALAACKDEAKNMQPPAPQVTIQEITLEDIELEYEYPGRVAGIKEVEIQARVEGIILERKYTEGKLVKQGDVLFQIDPEPFKASLKQAKAKLQDSSDLLKRTKRDLDRSEELLKRKFVTVQERDNALYSYQQAQASVKQAEAEVKTAQINLGYTKVVAPISGITSQESHSEGSLVGGSSGNNLLTRITQFDPVYINFAYPDSDALNRQKSGMQKEGSLTENNLKVEVRLGDNTAYPHEGDINFTDVIIDSATGTINARAIVPNPEMKLLPGQFVRVKVKGLKDRSKAIIPEKAIIQTAQGAIVYGIDNENKAVVRPVALGAKVNRGQIVNSGLSAGDKVIIEGMIKVRPGQPVQFAKPEDLKKSQ